MTDANGSWRLSLYNNQGVADDLYFEFENGKLKCSAGNPGQLYWSTDVPITKLYEAIENGESLTSMYIRINDMVFNSEVEEKIQNMDILEDPLIKSLFSQDFGSYQKAQLKKIKENS